MPNKNNVKWHFQIYKKVIKFTSVVESGPLRDNFNIDSLKWVCNQNN